MLSLGKENRMGVSQKRPDEVTEKPVPAETQERWPTFVRTNDRQHTLGVDWTKGESRNYSEPEK